MTQPNATHVTHVEGGFWIPWGEHRNGNKHPGLRVHAIRFDNGKVWDAVSGWRPASMDLSADTMKIMADNLAQGTRAAQ